MINYTPKTKAPTKLQRRTLQLMIIIGVISIANFVYWFAAEPMIGNPILFWMLVITLSYSGCKTLYEWYHYWNISIPTPQPLKKVFTVDILTTYFPGEPYEMIVTTLEAIQKITYPHTTYLCDEANDPYLIEVCKKLGVRHVTREHKINAKAGNINNALQQATGEICLILDPDHIPQPNFLDPIIPQFNDDAIGFVQVVQSYYNQNESFVAKGAAQQTFQFYGPMMMTMNSYGTVNAIGANCTFRRAALDSIGGHAPGLAEDMHTAMQLHAKGWKSVYVPEVLAIGMAPSTLTAYYKQQLKWSRGTLDLLTHVYPKLFRKFDWRQKIHYALLPLHYIIGLIYLINFLIPIISLMTSEMPWKGNLAFFGIINLPIVACTLLVRSYVQRWVMNEDERGFHLVGGLLQISAWWIFLLGTIYTIIGKKIPYLPTPKDDTDKTTWQLLAPNIAVGTFSIIAVIYGLSRDFTPFSIFMSGFALLNSFFMFFTIYLGKHTYTDISKTAGYKKTISTTILRSKQIFWAFRHQIYRASRSIALPLLLVVIMGSAYAANWMHYIKWEGLDTTIKQTKQKPVRYLGIFSPSSKNGITSLENVAKLEEHSQIHFDIVSLYLAWGDKSLTHFPDKLVSDIYSKKSIPLISWEPWASGFDITKKHDTLSQEKKVFKHIAAGYYDSYILAFAERLKKFQKPLFLRFGHEFDNPQYPWSQKGDNTPEEFIAAWRHVHTLFQKAKATNTIWVWNPWKASAIESYYPGAQYVDWVGITGLNYASLNSDKKWYSFAELYTPFKQKLAQLPKHPVMIAEFGSLKDGGDQQQWIKDAFHEIDTQYPEVRSVVFFNSDLDQNWPENSTKRGSKNKTINWSVTNFEAIKEVFDFPKPPSYLFDILPESIPQTPAYTPKTAFISGSRGVNYKKGQLWIHDYYTLTKKHLDLDFAKIKDLGIDIIKYQGSDIYDYNILQAAKRFRIDIAYSFWIPESLDFIEDQKSMQKLTAKIIATISEYQKHQEIQCWHISNDIFTALTKNYDTPISRYQQEGYLRWLHQLINAIRKIDTNRPIIVDLELQEQSTTIAKKLLESGLAIDAFGLIVNNDTLLEGFEREAKRSNIPYIFSDIYYPSIPTISKSNHDKSLFLRNWQDQLESTKISFDGLLDHSGKYKKGYRKVANYWNTNTGTIKLPAIRILKPAKITNPGTNLTYYALVHQKEEWIHANPETTPYTFSWSLVKSDVFGNPLGTKALGTGVNIQFAIPKNDKLYMLQLSVSKGDHVTTIRTTLNTPLSQDGETIQY